MLQQRSGQARVGKSYKMLTRTNRECQRPHAQQFDQDQTSERFFVQDVSVLVERTKMVTNNLRPSSSMRLTPNHGGAGGKDAF